MPASLLLSCLLSLVPAPPADGAPTSFHVGSYASPLGARATTDGFVDSGAIVGRFVDLDTGLPLALSRVHLDGGPGLELGWQAEGSGWTADGEVGATAYQTRGDERLLAGLRVLLRNEGQEPITARIGLDLFPAPPAGGLRPEPSLTFDGHERWEHDDVLLSRGGRVVARWYGAAPEVELTPPASAEDRVARLSWTVMLPPRNSRFVECTLVGAPAGATEDEEAYRRGLQSRSYRDIEDERRWESDALGSFSTLHADDERFRDAFVAAVAQIRTLGGAHRAVTALSDRPYGRPASDEAVSAQMLGVLFEVGMEEISFDHLVARLGDVDQVLDGLVPERQLMYLHGLARAVRLLQDDVHAVSLGAHVARFAAEAQGYGILRVDPWLHPENVHADLAHVLMRSGRGGVELLPELTFADVTPGSSEAVMQDLAKAVKERDGTQAWSLCRQLLDRTDRRGFGTLSPDGEADGRWALGMATLCREMLLDDHSEELHIFSGVDYDLLTRVNDLDVEYMPTRFGLIKVQQYHVGRGQMGGWVRIRTDNWPERMLMHFPPSGKLKGVKGTPQGGHVTVLDANTAELVVLPNAIQGLRFSVRVKPLPEDE